MATQSEATTETKTDGPPAQQTATAPPERASARTTPFGPFAFMAHLFDNLVRMWGGEPSARARMFQGFVPLIEVSRHDDKLVVQCDLPGLSPADVQVESRDGALVISGERRSEHAEQDENTSRCERSYGAFQRIITLPEGADPSSAEARFDNGVLEVTMNAPAQPETRGRKVEIQTLQGETPRRAS
jgi:HSP20 family protein